MRQFTTAHRAATAALGALVASIMLAGQTFACAGLIGPNGAVNLLRTTTFAGYHAGVEHYVTAFKFAGGGGKFGSIVPLPGIPSDVVRGGDWTLQRLVRETSPIRLFALDAAAAASAPGAEVLLQTRIDALDITVLRGGGADVGKWATDHGFRLHLVWGAQAAPSEKAYATINDSPSAIDFSWDLSTTPVPVAGHADLKPTSLIVIDSTAVAPADLTTLEDALYGTAGTAHLPLETQTSEKRLQVC